MFNNMKIKQITRYTDIMFLFPPKLRYYAEVEAGNGTILCAYEGEEPAGLMCLRRQSGFFDTVYIYVIEKYRKKGVAIELMKQAGETAKKEGKALRLRILQNTEYAEALAKIAGKMNMHLLREATIFRMEVNAQSRSLWEEARPKLMDTIERIEKRTGRQRVITFEQADKALFERLKSKIGSGSPAGSGLTSGLNPFSLPDLAPAFSFLMLDEASGEPTGFIAARVIGNKMIHEISSAQRGRTIAVCAPLYFDKLFTGGINQVTCIVYNDNPAGMNHAGGRFGFLFKEKNKQQTYELSR